MWDLIADRAAFRGGPVFQKNQRPTPPKNSNPPPITFFHHNIFTMKNILFICLLAALLAACKKDSDSDSNPTSTADFYFVGKLDGTAVKEELTATNDVELTSSNGASIGATNCTFDYGADIGSSANAKPYFGVAFPALFSGDCGDEGSLFSGLFHTGAWTYGANTGKVEVIYFDGTQIWSSASGTQSGAVFNVTKSEKITSPFGQSQTLGGTVSCQLYSASGAVKKLEGGSFVLNFLPWF